MSTLTHLCLNRLESEPYLHRIIPYLTHYTQDHPGSKLVVISDKELLSKGLYLSLKENDIPVQWFGEHQPLPFNVLNGNREEVIRRFQTLGLLKQPTPLNGTDALLNQTTYLAITHALTILKTVKGNLMTLQDLTGFLSRPSYQQQAGQLLERFQKLPVANEWERLQHLEALNWFIHDYFPSMTNKKMTPTYEYGALGRLNLSQFEQEWLQIFPKQGVEHRMDLWQSTEVIIVDVHHLKQTKHAVISYLIELMNQSGSKNRPVHLFCDLSEAIPEDCWSEWLLNQNLEITQTQHQPRESLMMDYTYESRSIKFLQYYSISNKEALMHAIQQFKSPGQQAYEQQQKMHSLRREELLRKARPTTTESKPQQATRSVELEEDLIDFS